MIIHKFRDEKDNVIHSYATASLPLPINHWIYAEPVRPPAISNAESELSHELRLKVREALKYTIQVCTSRGKDTDFDPDAMWMTLEHTLFSDDIIVMGDAETVAIANKHLVDKSYLLKEAELEARGEHSERNRKD